MTNEEAMRIAIGLQIDFKCESDIMVDFCNTIIKALEQETCEDCISRQAVLKALDKSKYSNEFCEEHNIDWSINLGMAHIVVNELKPVTSQPKIGRWIKYDTGHSIYYACSLCGCLAPCTETADSIIWKMANYCPDCGAKMEVTTDADSN